MTQVVRPRRASAIPLPALPQHPLLILNVRLPGYEGLKRIWVSSEGVVQAVEAMDQSCDRVPPTDLEVINLERDWLSLGGIDLQINGAQGLAFPDLCPDNAHELPAICEFLWEQGVDAFLPTLVTCSLEALHGSLQVLQDYCDRPSESNTARILGVHLEGPCLNPEKRGAHPQEHLQPLTLEAVDQIFGPYERIIKMVTLAPELDPTGEVVAELVKRGVQVSLGHSQATAAQALAAFEDGASLVTHAFNAMPGLHHREPGLLGAALDQPGVRCGFIADGQHITPLMLKLLLKVGREKLFLVSDALAPLGLPDGTYPWDCRQISVEGGTARLPDGTLSGTTLPLLAGVRNLVDWGLVEVGEAIALATTAPRQAIGYEAGAHDQLYVGRSLNQFLRWHHDPQVKALKWQRLLG